MSLIFPSKLLKLSKMCIRDSLPGGHEGGLQHPALDELPGLQSLVGLLHQVVPNADVYKRQTIFCLPV